MSTSKTVATRSTHSTTAQTLISATAAAGVQFSLHDCKTPGEAELWNCVYPINFASVDGKTFTKGIVVHSQFETSYNVTVITA